MLTFFLVELFDATGTLIGVCTAPGCSIATVVCRACAAPLLADSSAIVAGALLGTSSTTAYIESAAGTAAGGRTGLVAVVVAGLFLLSLFFAPLAAPCQPSPPPSADLRRGADGAGPGGDRLGGPHRGGAGGDLCPAMPFTFSIAHGIAFGFLSYAGAKLLAGRARAR